MVLGTVHQPPLVLNMVDKETNDINYQNCFALSSLPHKFGVGTITQAPLWKYVTLGFIGASRRVAARCHALQGAGTSN